MLSQRNPVRIPMLFLASMITLMTAAQIMFKFAGNHAVDQIGLIDTFLSNQWLWAGLLSSVVGMSCWLLTLRKMPLASAYPWTALIYVLTPLASAILFGEVLSGKYLLGMVCIAAGVFITAGGVDTR